MKNTFKYLLLLIFGLFCLRFPTVQAQDYGTSWQPIKKIDLGADSLTLEPGGSYTFAVTFAPEDPVIRDLTWFITDRSVLRVDAKTNTVTALQPGTARLMAESFDETAFALCDITVNGAQGKDSAGLIDGSSVVTISEADRAKINADRTNRYLGLLETSVFTEESLQRILDRDIEITAKVNPGTEEAESERALALDMTEAAPMKKLNLVALKGTFGQILEFVKENDDLIRIYELPSIYYFPDPKTGNNSLQPKTVQDSLMLQDHVEVLSSVSTIHKMGFTGKGATIAVLDTGLNRDHEQFSGKVIRENCFNSGTVIIETEKCSTCVQGDPDCKRSYACLRCTDNYDCFNAESCQACDPDEENCNFPRCLFYSENHVCENNGGSSYPGKALLKSEFDHGSHVAGIAAGRNGIAPDANIVAVNIQSEFVDSRISSGYRIGLIPNDELQALEWLLQIQDELKEEGKPISAVNMSFGSGKYKTFCDYEPVREVFFEVFQKLNDAGMIPVAAAGNDEMNGEINFPACMSNVIAVGALADMDAPMIVPFSNHSPLVDILAPGSNLYSAYLADTDGIIGTDTYGFLSGTSQATPVVSGSLALLMQAFPGKTPEEYKTMLTEMSPIKINRRNSDDPENQTIDDGSGMVFEYPKPVLNFSNFPAYYASYHTNHISFFRIENLEDHMPKTGFSALKPQSLSSRPLSVQYQPTHLTLQLPTLDVESDIVTVPYIDGEYPVEWLGGAVGLLEGSSFPGKGITVLTGHNHLNTTEAGPFALLCELEAGDLILITDQRDVMQTWNVYKSAKVPADGFGRITDDLRDNTMVLITCEDEAAAGGYLNRRIVLAEPEN